ncbi:MAG: calcium/sodium antiporter [Flavobacteriales bacterium]|nr:calcium/sodium antiporter [Flavobacteriales bacterium]MCB9447437.1 calcium/sodium antiporter [Flavobacteriales bacterium]
MNDYLYLLGGLIALVVSGEFLVRGAVALALRMRISTLVVGMTVVSFGTSAPELLVSVQAALGGHPDIAIGNVVGSNVANISLILGITALVAPVAVNRISVRIDWPMMMIASLLFWWFASDGHISLSEGSVFLVILVTFMTWLVIKSRREGEQGDAGVDEEGVVQRSTKPVWQSLLWVIAGCVGLAFGADWLIKGASSLAIKWGISEYVVAVTIVAFGTSVPELVTSIIASLKKETDITVGNLIGSNIFNLLGILGCTSLFSDIAVTETIRSVDVYWMMGIALLILPLMAYRFRVNRLSGFLLLITYLIYILHLF